MADLADVKRAGTETLLRSALEGLLDYVDGNTCRHEDRYQGGAIWTICRDCGRKWADDEGGFKPYRDPPQVRIARAALTAGQHGSEGR
jgi:hypothetical protein